MHTHCAKLRQRRCFDYMWHINNTIFAMSFFLLCFFFKTSILESLFNFCVVFSFSFLLAYEPKKNIQNHYLENSSMTLHFNSIIFLCVVVSLPTPKRFGSTNFKINLKCNEPTEPRPNIHTNTQSKSKSCTQCTSTHLHGIKVCIHVYFKCCSWSKQKPKINEILTNSSLSYIKNVCALTSIVFNVENFKTVIFVIHVIYIGFAWGIRWELNTYVWPTIKATSTITIIGKILGFVFINTFCCIFFIHLYTHRFDLICIKHIENMWNELKNQRVYHEFMTKVVLSQGNVKCGSILKPL